MRKSRMFLAIILLVILAVPASASSSWFWAGEFPLLHLERGEAHFGLNLRVDLSEKKDGCSTGWVSADSEINLPMPVEGYEKFQFLRVSTDVRGGNVKDVAKWEAALNSCSCSEGIEVCNGCFAIDNKDRAAGTHGVKETATNNKGHAALHFIIGSLKVGKATGVDDVLLRFNLYDPRPAEQRYIAEWTCLYPNIMQSPALMASLKVLAREYVLYQNSPNLHFTEPGLDYVTDKSFFEAKVRMYLNKTVTFRFVVDASRPYTLYVADQNGGRVTPYQRDAGQKVYDIAVTGGETLVYKIGGVYEAWQSAKFSEEPEVHESF